MKQSCFLRRSGKSIGKKKLMMLEESYKNNEAAFLEKIADKLNLKDKTRLVFIERFKMDNDDLKNSDLADI